MNTNTLPQSPVGQLSVAFQFGERDAKAGNARDPKTVFAQEKEQGEYAAGVASVNKIVVPNYRRNDREYTRRTDGNAAKALKANENRANRIDRMLAATAEFLGADSCDIIFAV